MFGSADTNAFGAGRIRLEGDAEVGGYIKNGKLYFNAKKQNAVLSIRSDSGVYDDGTGIIRYITTFDELKFPEKVVSFGVWIIPMEAFSDETFENTRTEILINKNDPDINSGMILANESFHADISDIPAVKLDEKILTVSFVNFSDGTVITAEYVSDGVNRENRLKRIYDGKLKTSVIGGREISY